MDQSRTEQQIFDELSELCKSPGFIHAIAFLCFRDNAVGFADELTADDLQKMHRPERLIRTEMSTLMGLMLTAPISLQHPGTTQIESYLENAQKLLEEIHHSMMASVFDEIDPEKISDPGFNPFSNASVMREPIFYSAESAYSFQYRDLTPIKYSQDADWLSTNIHWDISQTALVVSALSDILNERHIEWLQNLKSVPPHDWTMIGAFKFSISELVERSGVPVEIVRPLINSFTFPNDSRNVSFRSLSDFNESNAYPIIGIDEDSFLLFQYQTLTESIYETPFFWMNEDEEYAPHALAHRGEFTEHFVQKRLESVFGCDRVFRGARLFESKGKELGEIDVLVIFGDHLIIVQAKSKRLTLAAKKGNDQQLKNDFKKAIQNAADQASVCANGLISGEIKLVDESGSEIQVPSTIGKIFPICVVADHYPALSFQARQFLKTTTSETIVETLATDVFALDTMCEMLETPLRVLSYLSLRAMHGEKFLASTEHVLLSYHLKHNLWGDPEYNMMLLDDDISTDLDVAMAVRREGLPGQRTPQGILTLPENSFVNGLIKEIENEPNPATIGLGTLLLEISGETIDLIDQGVGTLIKQCANDGRPHDLTIGIEKSGLTIHANSLPDQVAREKLATHCEMRKYVLKAESWYGCLIRPSGELRAAVQLSHPWAFDGEMENFTADMRKSSAKNLFPSKKPGRNSPCPCGSGKKYKKCCL